MGDNKCLFCGIVLFWKCIWVLIWLNMSFEFILIVNVLILDCWLCWFDIYIFILLGFCLSDLVGNFRWKYFVLFGLFIELLVL